MLSSKLVERCISHVDLSLSFSSMFGDVPSKGLSSSALKILLDTCEERLIQKINRIAQIELSSLVKDLDELECDLLMKGISLDDLREQLEIITTIEENAFPSDTLEEGLCLEQALPIEDLLESLNDLDLPNT